MSTPLSRRDFLASTASLAAGIGVPLILPRSARASARVGPNDRIGVGIIGMGLRARELLDPLLANAGLALIAVCDVDTKRRDDGVKRVNEHYSKQEGLASLAACKSIVDYHELLALPGIDAVVITTPDHWHSLIVLDAVRARKHIYAEKPLTHTLAEGKALMEAVKKSGLVFQTGSQQRTEFSERFIQATEHVHAGHIGRILNINVGVADAPKPCDLPGEDAEPGLDWDRWLGPAPQRPYHSDLSPRGVHGHYPAWRRYTEYSGGYLADMGAHHFDIAQWMLGMDQSGPREAHPPKHPAAMVGARLTYHLPIAVAPGGEAKEGEPTYHVATVTHGGPSGLVVVGTDGMIRVDRGELSSSPGDVLKKEVPEAFRLPRPGGHVNQWVDAMKAGKPDAVSCPVEVGVRSAAVCQLLNLAYQTRAPIQWNAKSWKFRDGTNPELMDKPRRKGFDLIKV